MVITGRLQRLVVTPHDVDDDGYNAGVQIYWVDNSNNNQFAVGDIDTDANVIAGCERVASVEFLPDTVTFE